MTKSKKPLLLGERKADGVLKGHPVPAGDCIWCDDSVWASDMYTYQFQEAKPIHKICVVDIVAVSRELLYSIAKGLRKL